MAIVTRSDRPKSARNRCVIEVFGGVFVLSLCFLDFSVGVGAFVIGPSKISSFFSYRKRMSNMLSYGIPNVQRISVLCKHFQESWNEQPRLCE